MMATNTCRNIHVKNSLSSSSLTIRKLSISFKVLAADFSAFRRRGRLGRCKP